MISFNFNTINILIYDAFSTLKALFILCVTLIKFTTIIQIIMNYY